MRRPTTGLWPAVPSSFQAAVRIDTKDIETSTAHRPWPLPDLPWVMFQSWRHLLFAHWPLPADRLRPLVPAALELEEYEGRAWLGMTPFVLESLRPRCLPAVPGLSTFPEMNLRTYVRVEGKPGIFFFSLDAASRLAVAGARLGYRLPYRHARMHVRLDGGWVHYRSRRDDGSAEFEGRYRPDGRVFEARDGTLEHFLAERYALYTVLRSGSVLRGDIHHHPWPLQTAEAEITRNTVPQAHGIDVPTVPPLLHFSERQDTLVWPPVRVG